MQAFSFEKEPFPDAADGEFFFSTPALTARLAELCAAIENGHVLLMDEAGSGKSTMLDSFAGASCEDWRIFRLCVGEHHSAKEFTHALVSTFGLPLREPIAAELRDADTLLELLTTRSQIAVIVIDDVHLLERAALEQLLYLAKRWEPYSVRFLICAEPGLKAQLDSLPDDNCLTGRVTTLAVPRFDLEQVSDYLHMCLFRAGLVGDSPFDPTVVSEVTKKARGLVGAIDPIARDLLKENGTKGRKGGRGGAAMRRWPVAIVAVAGLGALLTVAVPSPSTPQDRMASHRHLEVFRSGINPAPRESALNRRERSASADSARP